MAQTATRLRDLANRCEAENFRPVAHHDLNGVGDAMQIVKKGDFVYVAHVGYNDLALSILDVSDVENPKMVRQIPKSKNAHSHKVQIVGNIMIQNSESLPYVKKADDDPPVCGVIVYSLDDPTDPQQIGFYHVQGRRGVHRMWFRDMPYAHISSQVRGAKNQGYHIVDLSDPRNPTMAGCWWVPGTFPEDPNPWVALDPEQHELSVHGVIPLGDRGYCSCTDAGLVILDISDMGNIRVVSRVNWCPPYAGFAHTSMPLPGRGLLVEVCEAHMSPHERDRDRRIWMIDIRDERQPVMISSFPRPKPLKSTGVESFYDLGDRFGPHNIHENYAGSFVSEQFIFSTWFNAGVRVHDISDADRPQEIGFFRPPPPEGQRNIQLNDLYVDADGMCYAGDRINGGLYIAQYTGPVK
ncbi:MAG TPA: hypothetical protein VFC51_19210 [Chloroflexota bacterium]|nr:hypothetical protein [Chloroflexota bacterium]